MAAKVGYRLLEVRRDLQGVDASLERNIWFLQVLIYAERVVHHSEFLLECSFSHSLLLRVASFHFLQENNERSKFRLGDG